jgi:phosphatidyl-myo-inositol alpha-mannosyltransferase
VINYGKVPLETLTQLYRAAWVFCLPSTYEGFGVPYIEAMASGTPVVASPNPGAKEVLGDGAYGLLVEDPDLGEQIVQLLQNEQNRSELVAKGLQQAQQYDLQRVAQAYVDIYRQLIDP